MTTIVGIANLSSGQAHALGDALDKLAMIASSETHGRRRSSSETALIENLKSIVASYCGIYKGKSSLTEYVSRVRDVIRLWQERYYGFLRPATKGDRGSRIYCVARSYSKQSGLTRLSPFVVVEDDLQPAVDIVSYVTGMTPVDFDGSWAFELKGFGYSKTDALVEPVSVALFGDGYAIRGELL